MYVPAIFSCRARQEPVRRPSSSQRPKALQSRPRQRSASSWRTRRSRCVVFTCFSSCALIQDNYGLAQYAFKRFSSCALAQYAFKRFSINDVRFLTVLQDDYSLQEILESFHLPDGKLVFSFEELCKATSMSKTVSPAVEQWVVCHSAFLGDSLLCFLEFSLHCWRLCLC